MLVNTLNYLYIITLKSNTVLQKSLNNKNNKITSPNKILNKSMNTSNFDVVFTKKLLFYNGKSNAIFRI